ncbi:MAG: SurA N-terminal domain-containing protein [Nitratireductor sp.]
MITMLRGAAGGWTAKIFLVLLAASFAVYGVSSSTFSGPGNSVISVGETEVDILDYRLAYANQTNALSRQLGTQITNEQAQLFGIPQSVLTTLTSSAVLDENARKMGLGISEKQLSTMIGDDPSFKDATGNFSRARLRGVLNQIGMSEQLYVKNRKAVAVRSQLIEGVSQNTNLPKAFYDIVEASQAEERVLEYALLSEINIDPVAIPSDDEISTYFEANKQNYLAPEFRKVTIVKLEPSDIADESKITREALEEAYEQNQSQYVQEEIREVQQLVFTDKEKAEAAAKRIADGERFETILNEQSKTASDISLGKIQQKDIPDETIAKAAFSTKLNEVSGAIKGIFGYVLLRTVEITPKSVKPLEEVEDALKKQLALTIATGSIFDTHDKIEDDRAAGETLTNAAKLSGLTARVVANIDSSGRDINGDIIADLPIQQKLISEIFNAGEGVETAPLNIDNDGLVWYEVNKITDERQKTLDEVKDDVIADWSQAETNKAVEALANKVREEAISAASLETALKNILKINDVSKRLKTSKPLLRSQSNDDLSQETVQSAFAIENGSIIISNGEDASTKIVIKVSDVKAQTPSTTAQTQIDQYNGALQNDVLSGLVVSLQENQSVVVNNDALAAALSSDTSRGH